MPRLSPPFRLTDATRAWRGGAVCVCVRERARTPLRRTANTNFCQHTDLPAHAHTRARAHVVTLLVSPSVEYSRVHSTVEKPSMHACFTSVNHAPRETRRDYASQRSVRARRYTCDFRGYAHAFVLLHPTSSSLSPSVPYPANALANTFESPWSAYRDPRTGQVRTQHIRSSGGVLLTHLALCSQIRVRVSDASELRTTSARYQSDFVACVLPPRNL